MSNLVKFQTDLSTRLSDVFQDLFSYFPLDQKSYNLFPSLKNAGYPRINLYNTEKETVIEATVPGLTKDDVNVDWKDNLLTISYQKCSSNEDKKKDYYFREIHQSSFSRSVQVLQSEYDVEHITAVVENGMLKVMLPLLKPMKNFTENKKITVN